MLNINLARETESFTREDIEYMILNPNDDVISTILSITNKSGQAFYNIGKERLSAALLPIPSLMEQQRIVAQIEKLFEQLR